MSLLDEPEETPTMEVKPFKTQLLKWIGNKQRFAHEIAGYFPAEYSCYYEPFLGSGAVLGTIAPHNAVGSDAFGPLVGIFQQMHADPEVLIGWYEERWKRYMAVPERDAQVAVYEEIKASYNKRANSADFVFLARSCYGGVVRFRKADGYMSTPCGPHRPVDPASFRKRVLLWAKRTQHTTFKHLGYAEAIAAAGPGDIVYCDPPYTDTQAILYGAQAFSLPALMVEIAAAKDRGALVALSIDGTKRSGSHEVDLPIPDGLFEREAFVNCGRSMLRRFQMIGETLEDEVVSDRLLLTW
jgi:DNA adenine methylase